MSALETPFRFLHAMRTEPVMGYSSRLTAALLLLDEAAPQPVPTARFTEVFGCAPPETSGVLSRMRTLGLAERCDGENAYRLGPEAHALRARIIARIRDGGDLLPSLLATPTPVPSSETHA